MDIMKMAKNDKIGEMYFNHMWYMFTQIVLSAGDGTTLAAAYNAARKFLGDTLPCADIRAYLESLDQALHTRAEFLGLVFEDETD